MYLPYLDVGRWIIWGVR